MAVLPVELRNWLAPGLAGTLASVGSSGQPQMARVWAARAAEGGDELELYVQRSTAAALAAAVTASRRGAVNLIEVATYRSLLFKGPCDVSARSVDEAFLAEYLAALDRAFASVGMGERTAERMLSHAGEEQAMLVFSLAVESIFDQSPKHGAGARL
jgi:hypothetical protein